MKPRLLTDSRWRVHTSFGCLVVFAFMIGTKWLKYSDDDRLSDLSFYLMVLWILIVGFAIQFASSIRYLDQRQDEIAKQAAVDSERIWKLEATIAELKGSGKPTP